MESGRGGGLVHSYHKEPKQTTEEMRVNMSDDSIRLTESELAEIEKRCAAATNGPWVSYVEGRDICTVIVFT